MGGVGMVVSECWTSRAQASLTVTAALTAPWIEPATCLATKPHTTSCQLLNAPHTSRHNSFFEPLLLISAFHLPDEFAARSTLPRPT